MTYHGDCRDVLKTLPDMSVHCCVTSPPYWGLRDYGLEPVVWGGDATCGHEWGETVSVNATNHTDKRRWQHTRNGRDEEQPTEKRVAWLRTKVPQGQFCQECDAWAGCLGLEPTPQLYVEHMVEVFREVRRVLRDDGTLWLNLGDTYAAGGHGGGGGSRSEEYNHSEICGGVKPRKAPPCWSLKPKDLIGIPWRVALALQEDGWYLRSEIIWAKPNPMPESVTDRPTKSHEQIFLLAKSERYFYNREASAEEAVCTDRKKWVDNGSDKQRGHSRRHAGFNGRYAERLAESGPPSIRNARSVWTIPTQPYPEAHFATFPEELAKRCILAGCPEGGTVLDPFAGSGTVGQVAESLGCDAVLIEAQEKYLPLIAKRTSERSLKFT